MHDLPQELDAESKRNSLKEIDVEKNFWTNNFFILFEIKVKLEVFHEKI